MSETPCPPDRCYGCWWTHPRQGGHDPDVMDLRTGRRYCHECAVALLTWELDGCPDTDDHPYAEWLDDSVEASDG